MATEGQQKDELPLLVVDDDPSFISIVTASFSRVGWIHEVAQTGRHALDLVHQTKFRIVLLDLGLPDFSGIEVLRQVRLVSGAPPVILISGSGTIGSAVEAIKLGAHDFLEKPIRIPDLLAAIATSWRRAVEIPANQTPGQPEPSDPWPATRHATELVASDLVAVVCAPTDTPTVADWAHLLGVSSPVIATRCERARMSTKACLDLGRTVRARILSSAGNMHLTEILACRDTRTVSALLARGGVTKADINNLDLRLLLQRQQFVPNPHFVQIFLGKLGQAAGTKLQ